MREDPGRADEIQEKANGKIDILSQDDAHDAYVHVKELTTISEESDLRVGQVDADGITSRNQSPGNPRPETRPKLPSQHGRATFSRDASRANKTPETPTSGEDRDQDQALITEIPDYDIFTDDGASSSNQSGQEDRQYDNFDVEIISKTINIVQEENARKITRKTKVTLEVEEELASDCDTDLELDDDQPEKELKAQTRYERHCQGLGTVPVSYFSKHITGEKSLRMRYHGLSRQGVKAIARILKDNGTIEDLNLDGNDITSEGCKYIARLLADNECIVELSLAENPIGSKGAAYLSKAICENPTLRRLNLSGSRFQETDAPLFAEIIEDNKVLRDINLSYNQFGSSAGQILGPALGANYILDSLDLSWNNIRQKGAIALAKGLGDNVLLKKCNLSWNGFGTDGGLALCDALVVNSSLLMLDVSGNRLTVDVALKMAKSLQKNETLEHLKMGYNAISTAGCIALVTAIYNSGQSQLTHLDLSDIPVEFEFLRIVEGIKSKREFTVIHGPVLRSGNTAHDVGKPSISADKLLSNPLMLLKDSVVVKDARISELLKKYDDGSQRVTSEEFIKVLEELKVPFTRTQLHSIVEKLEKTSDGRIDYGCFVRAKSKEKTLNTIPSQA